MVAAITAESIRVEIEPQNSEIRIPISDQTRVSDVIRKVHELCRDNPNVDLGIWARQRVGSDRPTWRLFHVLLEPSRVKPPKLYSRTDHGINSRAMAWYQRTSDTPQRIHNWLLEQWGKRMV